MSIVVGTTPTPPSPLWREDSDIDVRHGLSHRPLVAAALGLVAVIYLANIGGFPAFFADEGIYYSQAWAVANMGDLAPFTYWYDHPPAGWVQIALFSWLPEALLPDQPALVAGRLVMVGYALVSAGLLYLLARRIGIRPGFALAAMLLWALSPLAVYEGRQILLDNVALPWVLGAFVLATGRTKSLWSYTMAGFVFGVAMLSKETVAAVFPALLVAVWYYSYRPTRAFAMVGTTIGAVVVGMFYPLYAILRNELLPGDDHVSLWDALVFQFASRTGTGPLWSEGSALYHWGSYDWLLMVAGLVAGTAMLLGRRTRFIGVAVLIVSALAFRPGGYLPYMYVIVILPFFALAIAVALAKVHDEISARIKVLAPVVVAAVLLAVGYQWAPGIGEALTAEQNAGRTEAVAWADANLPQKSRVVVDDTYWNDMVRAGWSPDYSEHAAITYIKIDNDPEAVRAMPSGWRGIDYFVYTNGFGGSPDTARTIVDMALKNSRVLKTFGSGDGRVEIRQVSKG